MTADVAQHIYDEYEAAARMGDSVRAHALAAKLVADDKEDKGSWLTEVDGVTLLFPL